MTGLIEEIFHSQCCHELGVAGNQKQRANKKSQENLYNQAIAIWEEQPENYRDRICSARSNRAVAHAYLGEILADIADAAHHLEGSVRVHRIGTSSSGGAALQRDGPRILSFDKTASTAMSLRCNAFITVMKAA